MSLVHFSISSFLVTARSYYLPSTLVFTRQSFARSNGKCVALELVGDGSDHCGDNSDEQATLCSNSSYFCDPHWSAVTAPVFNCSELSSLDPVIRILQNLAWPCKILFVTRLLAKSCIILFFWKNKRNLALEIQEKQDLGKKFKICGFRNKILARNEKKRISCENLARIYLFLYFLTPFVLDNGDFQWYDLPASLKSFLRSWRATLSGAQ